MTDLPELPSELVDALVAGFWAKPDDNSLSGRLSSALRAALAARGPSGRLLYLASELEQVGWWIAEDPNFLDSLEQDHPWVPVFRLKESTPVLDT